MGAGYFNVLKLTQGREMFPSGGGRAGLVDPNAASRSAIASPSAYVRWLIIFCPLACGLQVKVAQNRRFLVERRSTTPLYFLVYRGVVFCRDPGVAGRGKSSAEGSSLAKLVCRFGTIIKGWVSELNYLTRLATQPFMGCGAQQRNQHHSKIP